MLDHNAHNEKFNAEKSFISKMIFKLLHKKILASSTWLALGMASPSIHVGSRKRRLYNSSKLVVVAYDMITLELTTRVIN